MKIWYFVCSFFFLASFSILIEEGNEIVYKSIDQPEPFSYLICIFLKKRFNYYFKKRALDLYQLSEEMQSYFKEVQRYKTGFNKTKFNELILDPIKSRNYLIFNDQFCFIREECNTKDSELIIHFLKNEKIFLFKKDTYDFYKLKYSNENVEQLVVINKQYPHSNCIENYSKFVCLNRCFKRKYRLSKYFYTSDESGIVYLDYEYNQTIKNYENECLNECRRDDCKITNFTPKAKGKPTEKVFIATSLISKIDYLIQLVGLIFYIANTYFYQLLSKLFEFLDSKIKKIKIRRIRKIRKYLIYLKMAIVLVSISCALFYLYEKFEEMKKPTKNKMETYLTEPETLNLAICIPAANILKEDYNSNTNEGIYRNKTFSELEEETNRGFNDTVREIYLQFREKKIKTNYTITSKILFRRFNLSKSDQILSRCFQFKIYPNEPKYQSLLARSSLIILLRHSKHQLFILPKEENLKMASLSYSSKLNFIKIESKLKTNCVDYKKKGLNCFDQQDCLNRCVNMKFTEKYKSITSLSIIDKNHFTKGQWFNSLSNENKTNYELIENECRKKFEIEDCHKTMFENKFKKSEENKITLKRIDLYYDLIITIEDETSLYKLLIDFVNIQNILFGQNILKLLVIAYCFLNVKFKLNGGKYYLLLIYFIFLIGLITHVFFTFDQVLNNELVHFVYYTVENSIKMPNVIFCFNLEKIEINSNFKLTKNYLDEMHNLRKESVFEKIEYLNKSNGWSDFEFKIDTLYLLDKICFKIKQEIEYERSQFDLSEDRDVLKVYFNKSYRNKKNLNVYFFTKISNRMQISRMNELVLKFENRYYLRFTTSQRIIEYNYKDKFNFLKNPSSLFTSEADLNSLNDLMNNFESNFNLKSLYLPSENENLNNEINDGLFEQYCNQIQNIDYSSPSNSKIQKLFIINNLKKDDSGPKNKNPDFKFELNFLKNEIKITNEDNIVKLILSLLNVLSLWCDLCIFDLGIYVYYVYCKIKLIFIFIWKSFIRLDIYLYRRFHCY